MVPDELLSGFDLDGCAVLDVAGDFTWRDKAVDWEALDIIDDFSTLDAELIAQIDASAEEQRVRFITSGAGQAMEYQEALAQARACLAGEPEPFPMLEADVAAGTIDPRTGEPVADVAQAADLVVFNYEQWVAVGSTIREARLGAKVAVRAAETRATKQAAAMIDWATVLS